MGLLMFLKRLFNLAPPAELPNQDIPEIRKRQHAQINHIQPWERDEWSRQRRDAWREQAQQ